MTPSPLDPLAARRVLVVAPHPDDETLGCGGLIARLMAAGSFVHTIFLTDGGASHRASRTWPRPRLASLREREAAEALMALGAGDSPRTFLRLNDAAMPAPGSETWAAARDAIAGVVATLQPGLAVLPWRRDPHCDHRDGWHLAQEALRQANVDPPVLEYAIWLDELGAPEDFPVAGEVQAFHVDVSVAAAAKRAALAAHRSQTTDLIDDDPTAFRLRPDTIERLTSGTERFWRVTR
jgi:LmbE family N-acetylglucosaminyl deacetylase